MIKRLSFLLIGLLLILTAVAMVYYGYHTGYTADFPASRSASASLGAILLGILPMGFFLLIILGFVVWLAALVHMLKNPAIQGTEKIVWALVIIFLHILGAIIYFAVAPRPPSRIVSLRRTF